MKFILVSRGKCSCWANILFVHKQHTCVVGRTSSLQHPGLLRTSVLIWMHPHCSEQQINQEGLFSSLDLVFFCLPADWKVVDLDTSSEKWCAAFAQVIHLSGVWTFQNSHVPDCGLFRAKGDSPWNFGSFAWSTTQVYIVQPLGRGGGGGSKSRMGTNSSCSSDPAAEMKFLLVEHVSVFAR